MEWREGEGGGGEGREGGGKEGVEGGGSGGREGTSLLLKGSCKACTFCPCTTRIAAKVMS